ncbi:hypothetical protein C2S53_003119 [Perilla frutescens var. hirtella]|uniref:non-specific serine/threonine protein kinase n=1 Tax=Perilla frutescens var. hirtella TaxID=608512 RepID=A0AAD4JKQ8_PERFH|nr:hypothetical protein C2S53_003119 [Perilla frutescens var. hirtella]
MAQVMFNKILFKLFLSISFVSCWADLTDTLFHNQTIAIGQNLVSESQVFELGFFRPGISGNVFLGIWYKATPDIVVWVANRNNPITTPSQEEVVFAISKNGSLAISSTGGSVIWSTNPSRKASNPVVQLLDTGNLVVVDETTEGYIWQSFDYPTDTWLPGMTMVADMDAAGVKTNLTSWRNSDDPSPGDFVVRIENQGLPEIVIYKGTTKRFRNGKWNGLYFNGIPRFRSALPKPEFIFKEERLISMSRPYDSSVITRATLDISGSAHRYTMNPRRDKWNPVYTFPRDQCDEYGHCGPNAICTVENAQRCDCFRGFSPKFQNDWDLQDWSGGCARNAALNCESGDDFVEVRGVKYPDMLGFWLNSSMSLDECKVECLKNCRCTACANPYITNGGSGCLMWYGDLVDTRELSEADSMQNIYIRVPVLELDFTNNQEEKRPIQIVLISIASGVIVSSIINGGIHMLTRWKKRELKRKQEDIELPLIKMATILKATNNFSRENVIGKGGFGPVYMGNLSEGEQIAVKRLSRSSGQGLEEFKNEVILIAKLQHRNLVRLLGCCIEGEERVLIYEYLQNKSLDYLLFDPDRKTVLTWPKRYEIIMGIARGLLYLHHDSSGYMAPEYANYGKFSVKSDIFSLGVVLIEIISGKKNRGFEDCHHYHSLLSHAWLLWKEKRIMEVMDKCLNNTYMESQVKRCIHVGLLCVQNFLEDRPVMSSVVLMLASDGAVLPEPKEPGYFIERSCSSVGSCTSPTMKMNRSASKVLPSSASLTPLAKRSAFIDLPDGILILKVGAVDDHTLFPNQTLLIGQTLVSHNQVFEMGFFSPGKSSNRFLGIWYKTTPDVVVWVANRNDPITDSQVVVFTISRNGSLVISRDGSIIWSANPSTVTSNPFLQLLDTGNLVLVDNTTEVYLWQSFDYPTDTILPGMKFIDDPDSGVERYLTSWKNLDDPSHGDFVHKIKNQGLPDVVTLRGATKRYRQGQWNGIYFGGGPRFPSANYKPELVFKEDRLISLGEPYEGSVLMRATLDTSGTILLHTMNDRKDKWNLALTFPQDTCDEYGICGPNGICRSRTDNPVRCQCLKGFIPKFQKQWDLQDWSGGCTRTKPLNCQKGDGFLEVRGVKYPDMLRFQLNRTMSLGECKVECLKNCSCTAYANPFITNEGSGCLMWFSHLIDIRELSAADSMQNIYIRIPVSEQDEEEEKKRPMKLILISIASGVLVSAFINGGILFMTRRKRREAQANAETLILFSLCFIVDKRYGDDLELPVIKMAIIVQATNNFSMENMIGVGGFGPVYKGNMPLGQEIAVKRLSRSSTQGLEEFKNEIMVIAKLQHRNLVRLLGCCIEEEERMLIYEYLQNKSLDHFVFDDNRRTLLTWPKRYDIIMGIARGLLYLHHDSRLKIIHRDLKTSNILLDGNLNPKISDFGLARIFEEDQSLARTKRVVGTFGYMSPEYAIDGKFSEKSDIFSLGVVLLEIISGEKNRGFEHCDHYLNLLGHAWLLWKENKIMELMDECLNDTFIESQVKRCMQVGLLCVQKFAKDRPTMPSVVSMLGTDDAILPEPKEPGFFIERNSSPNRSYASPSKSEDGTITITDLEAR